MTILQAQALKKYYGGGDTLVKALDGVDLSVEEGEFVAIVGTSGSGKSTLLHMLGGLDRPTSGTVTVEGKNIFSLKDEALTIFQQETSGILAVDGIDFPLNPVLEGGYEYFLDGKYYLPATAWKYSDALGNNMTINSQEIVAGNMTIEEFVQDMDDTRTELDAEQ